MPLLLLPNGQRIGQRNENGRFNGTVIDDQDRVRVVIREMLQMKGYIVLDTGDPQVALDLTKKHAIHLLLADVVMPLTGSDLAWRGRSARRR